MELSSILITACDMVGPLILNSKISIHEKNVRRTNSSRKNQNGSLKNTKC